ncbi:hypothetical protein [Accumulibacter sp.]|uniref:hypothetical protein n=1 Tax=Accumulibacter sp. TaxID=2053492 RepID=UPI002C3D6B7A|nr:hypothetical protein [Accumulibacter sp.]HPU78937.1 hypothetical protein [Accumulibacter sp.]
MISNEDARSFSSARTMALPSGWFGKLMAIMASATLVVVGLMFSVLALAVLLVGGTLLFAYLKWKTRHLRRVLDAQMQPARAPEQQSSGRVIEGEIIGDAEYDANSHAPARNPLLNEVPASREQQPESATDR